MNAIGYIRVSTQKQIEGVSLENQMERIDNYCRYKGFHLVEIIEDAGVSGGKNKARPGFIELLDRLETDQHRVLILYSLERLSRDMLTLLALERLLDEYDIELHTIEGQIDTSTPDGFMGFAMRAFMGEMERRQVKYRTKKAMEYKKGQGAVVGSVPYGYKRNGNGLEPEPSEQKVISRVNRLYGHDTRLADICRHLKAKGIRTRSGRNFSPEQVKRLIDGYKGSWTKSGSCLSRDIKRFVTAIA